MVDEGDAVTTPAHAPGDGGHDAPSPAPAVPGHELGALLARGGTSEVWAGVALDDGRRVAVKVVHADVALVEAAAREAAVSAAAASAHVVAVEACVELPDGRVALVMPHLLGGALDGLVRARGHLSPGEVVTVRIRIVQSPPQFVATFRNGVNSTAYGNYPAGAFEFVRK